MAGRTLTELQTWDMANGVKSVDAGPSQTLTRTYIPSADLTTAAAITPAPTAGQAIVAMDILVSNLGAVAIIFNVQMESTANILAKVPIAAGGFAQITLRGFLKGDAADKKIFGKTDVASAVGITAVTFSEPL